MADAAEAVSASPNRKIYGRGFFDGLRMAGIDNPEEFLNTAKQSKLENSLTNMARKVLEAVPIQAAWSASQIIGEMVRMTASKPDFKIVMGCLNSLVDAGLVREPEKGHFQRIKARPSLAAVPPAPVAATPAPEAALMLAKPVPNVPNVPKQEEQEPLARMSYMASNLRELSRQTAALADGLETIALDVESRMDRIHADTEKLRQLQALLKSIGQ